MGNLEGYWRGDQGDDDGVQVWLGMVVGVWSGVDKLVVVSWSHSGGSHGTAAFPTNLDTNEDGVSENGNGV
ncbi:hypothetical protein E2562_025506 [Oryza meyeriana var. granulata]|uniref:Uncharacterized protein n=1 Tax=Oryza meyeriana var. granulata TaxID=110450 RepID=A0A6G1C8Q3_9ORYZ|nr:hypothetical protein E2562_025506 [Oryza meyeriana var. granulata]